MPRGVPCAHNNSWLFRLYRRNRADTSSIDRQPAESVRASTAAASSAVVSASTRSARSTSVSLPPGRGCGHQAPTWCSTGSAGR